MDSSKDLIQPKIDSYLKSTWYARWIIIAIVSIGIWIVPTSNRKIIIPLLGLAIIYNTAIYFGGKHRIRLIVNREMMLIIDGLMSLILIAYTGFISSPYLFILIFMIVSASFWYGWRAIALIATLQVTGLIVLELLHSKTHVYAKNLFVQTLIVMTLGTYVSWLTKYERLERNELVRIGTETEKERQRLSALINSVRDSVLVLDNHDQIVIYNHATAVLVGTGQPIKGRSLNEVVHVLDGNDQITEFKINHGDPAKRHEIRVRAADNSIVNMEISVAPYIVDRQNRGNVVILHDKSEDKTAAEERKEFIAVASHELRTPLAIAESDLSLLLSPAYLPENKASVNMLNSALRSLTQLSHIISDLTNLSQIENEKFEIDLEPLNPIGLMRELQADYGDQARAKGLELKIEDDKNFDAPTILTSRYVVQEILTIFISNAIKFTDSGSIILNLAQSGEKKGTQFSVRDSGIGISQSDQKNIFEKFFQSEHYAKRIHGGTGLGLYISKQLAMRINATIWFESDLGKGSVFYLFVPPYVQKTGEHQEAVDAENADLYAKA